MKKFSTFIKLIVLFFMISCDTEEPDSGFYILQPNAYFMLADGKSTLYLEVFRYENYSSTEQAMSESNHTDDAVFYHNGEKIPGNTFTTTEKGEHRFSASIDGRTTEDVIVVAREDETFDIVSIPLIFHVVYNDEPVGTGSNIAAETIYKQVVLTNQRYNNTFYSIHYPHVVPSPNHVDTRIQFRLAKFDPYGNALDEPGIIRHGGYNPMPWTSSDSATKFMAEHMWPAEDYVNITIANSHLSTMASGTTATHEHKICGAGYTAESWAEHVSLLKALGIEYVFSGIYWEHGLLNTHGITLAHELGHHLGLNHNYGFNAHCSNVLEYGNCLPDTQYYEDGPYEFRLKDRKMRRDCNNGNWVIYDNIMGNPSEPYEASLKEDVYWGFTFEQRNFIHEEVLSYATWVKELKNSDK